MTQARLAPVVSIGPSDRPRVANTRGGTVRATCPVGSGAALHLKGRSLRKENAASQKEFGTLGHSQGLRGSDAYTRGPGEKAGVEGLWDGMQTDI